MRIPLPIASECDGCSACCESIGLPPFEVPNPDLGFMPRDYRKAAYVEELYAIDLDTFVSMPAELRAEHARLVTEFEGTAEGQPCVWLDRENKRCKHYDYRPVVCRVWEPGGNGCRAAKRGAMVVWRGNELPDDWWNPLLPRREEAR